MRWSLPISADYYTTILLSSIAHFFPTLANEGMQSTAAEADHGAKEKQLIKAFLLLSFVLLFHTISYLLFI